MSTATLTETLRINDTAPDFTAETTQGTINFHQWIGDGWAILFSHPKDFTPVCTTELGYMAGLQPEFAKRNCKIIGLSVDPVSNHSKWAADIEETQGHKVNYPMIGDTDLKIAKLYGMLPAGSGHTSEGRSAADNATVRTVFVVGPDKKIKLMLIYPMSTGRNFDEVLRVLDSIQLTAKHKVATPVNWKQGGDVIIAGGFKRGSTAEISWGLEVAQAVLADRSPAKIACRSGVSLTGTLPRIRTDEHGSDLRSLVIRGNPFWSVAVFLETHGVACAVLIFQSGTRYLRNTYSC